MKKLMNGLYDNIDEAKAFALSFTNFVYFYDSVNPWHFHEEICGSCKKTYQKDDYLAPKSSCKKDTGILHSLEFGVSPQLRDDLIARFDVTEADFRPVRNKKREVVYYQITPQHVMLPLHKENGWICQPPCPNCGSVRYEYGAFEFRNDKKEFYYYISQAALDDMHDFNVTFEAFRWYRPICVISRRVYDYLTGLYPRTHYYPFFLCQEMKTCLESDQTSNHP